MIWISLGFSAEGLLEGCRLRGHAVREAGTPYSLICAAASVLVRTAARTLGARPGFILVGEAAEPGLLAFTVQKFPPADKDWLRGVGDTLKMGFEDLLKESPGQVKLEIDKC
ncbi:MAG: ribosomal-processing cysteine protease Prp [Spirochaetales bacterium]|nr:ribosomal-processing cysteine protease Prp [Spirochaetales bacterium]